MSDRDDGAPGTGRAAADFYADPTERDAVFEEIRRSGGVQNREIRLRTATGREFVGLYSAHPVRAEDGTFCGIQGIIRDISGRKAAEERLRESEERFRLAQEMSPMGMAIVSLDGQLVEVNDALCRMLGYSRAGLVGTCFADVTHPDDLEADRGQAERLLSGDFDPRVYEEPSEKDGEDGASADGTPGPVVDVTPFPLKEREGLPATAFDSFNAALDDYFFRLDRSGDEDGGEEPGSDRPDFEEQIAKQERIIEQQQGAIENFEQQAEQEREKAETLYANYEVADEIIRTIRGARENEVPWDDIAAKFQQGAEQGIAAAEAVESVDGSDATVTVTLDDVTMTLDTTMGVEKNADRLYTEAKRVAEKKEGALAAIEDTREELEAVKKRREEWEAEDDEDEESDEDEQEDVDWLSRSSIPIRETDDWYERFRWFHTSDGYLVIGGRNADQNEEIVKKYLNKHDRFFHTQAHGGPVTILKATGPSEPAKEVDFPDSSLQEAAQFAVSYSSIWKEGRFADDAYMVTPDQVSKTPESGEYIEKGGFVIRGDRTYFRDVEAEVAVGVQCEPVTRVVGGPPSAIEGVAETTIRVEPGKFAQNDMATMLYRRLKERFADQSFVRKVASADRLQEFLPPGGSEIVDD